MPEKEAAKRTAKEKIYQSIIAGIFRRHYRPGIERFEFQRTEIEQIAGELHIDPKNIGDLIYSFRFRAALPKTITDTAPAGHAWLIELAGRGKYRFRLCGTSQIAPRTDLLTIKIPNSTPEIISQYALTDEQALLARVRYNRLLDVFLGITAYSLQNHLRTTVREMGQIEIDEVYVGVNRQGAQFIVPVQAKGGKDKLGVVQTMQDVGFCRQQFPQLICRPVATQFMRDDVIAMFELVVDDDEVKVLEERHYQLVDADSISEEDLRTYNIRE